MKKDIGFWDINGNYIEDIQELNEIERKEIMETKNYDEFFDELNDMANFKNFGESKEEEITNADGSRNWEANILLDNVKRLEQENTELKAENERLKEENGGMQILIDNYIALTEKYHQTLQEIKDYINAQGIDNTWNMRIQRFRMGILDLITEAEEE